MTDAPQGPNWSLRVMSWNVHGSARPHRDGLAAAIRTLHPDVVAIQEVRIGQAHRLANRLGWEVQWVRKHFPLGPLLWWRAEGLAVLSRFRITTRNTWVLTPGLGNSTYRRRIAQQVTVRMEHDGNRLDINVVNTHLASHHDGHADRREQSTRLVSLLESDTTGDDAPTPLLVLGDLNAHDEPDVMEPLRRLGLRDAWDVTAERVASSGLTAPSHQPTGRIDYVLAGPGWSVTRLEVPLPDDAWTRCSDHLPVIVDLERDPADRAG